MKVQFTNRAVADLQKISARSRKEFGDKVAGTLAMHLRKVIEQISRVPERAPRIVQRSNMRVLPLVRYPFKIYYKVADNDTIRILHIRHTARRPWTDIRN